MTLTFESDMIKTTKKLIKKRVLKELFMISVCIITKNQSKNIKECLKRLTPLDYEIIVVDTGSTDNTKDIALEYTDKVFDYKWCDDFSAARNFSIGKATQEYVLIIDSDEFLTEVNKTELENLIRNNSKYVGRICRTNVQWDGNEQVKITERINRLFPKELYHYTGRIHEQIVTNEIVEIAGKNSSGEDNKNKYENKNNNEHNNNSEGKKEYITYNLPILIDHIGYDGDIEFRKIKTHRNIELLNKDLQENGEDPYTLYQLGKSYYMQQDYTEACEYFARALSFDLNPKLEYMIDMVETYGYALINLKQFKEALQYENIYEEFGNRPEFKFLMGLIYMNNEMYQNAIDEFLKATEYEGCQTEGVNTYKAFYNVGVIYECLGDVGKAISYYEKCEGYNKAEERMKILTTNCNNKLN